MAMLATTAEEYRPGPIRPPGAVGPGEPVWNGSNYGSTIPETVKADTTHLDNAAAQQAEASKAKYVDAGTASQIDYDPQANAAEATAGQAMAGQSNVDTSQGADVSPASLAEAQRAEASKGTAAAGTAHTGSLAAARAQAQAARAGTAGATTYNAQKGAVTPGMTAEGRLNSMLGLDSAYMRSAARQGQLAAAARGLGNSSFAAGSAMGAAIDRAAPIAAQDANAAYQNMRANVDAENWARTNNSQRAQDISLANAQMQTQISQLNAQLATAVSQGNAQAENQLRSQIAQLETQVSMNNAEMETMVSQDNARMATATDQLNAQLGTQTAQFNSAEANRVALRGSELMQQNQQFNAQITTQNGQFNAQMQTQIEQLNAQLATAVSQGNAQMQNQLIGQLLNLRTNISSQNAQMRQQMNQFNATQENQINTLNAQLETAVSQSNASEANRLVTHMAQLRSQMNIANAEMENSMASTKMQLDSAIMRQILSGDQSANLAGIQGEYAMMIQRNASAADLYNGFFNGIMGFASNPEFNANMLRGYINAQMPFLQAGLEFLSGVEDATGTGDSVNVEQRTNELDQQNQGLGGPIDPQGAPGQFNPSTGRWGPKPDNWPEDLPYPPAFNFPTPRPFNSPRVAA